MEGSSAMVTDQEIREELAKLLANAQTLDSLNEWLSRKTWNIHRESSSVRDLVGAIELRLAEFSDGHANRRNYENICQRYSTTIVRLYRQELEDKPLPISQYRKAL
jgi:hypothetical protein